MGIVISSVMCRFCRCMAVDLPFGVPVCKWHAHRRGPCAVCEPLAGNPVRERPPPRMPARWSARWSAALAELRALQAEYEAWRDQLPESLADSRTAELLEGVCVVDLNAVDVELPQGFGRD